jgi:NAD(P)H-hydrate epimerase
MLAGRRQARVVVVCGKGNNGGDGLVVARLLAQHGARVAVGLTDAEAELSPDARTNRGRLSGTGVSVDVLPAELCDPGPLDDPRRRPTGRSAAGRTEPTRLATEAGFVAALAAADLCVDALLGTGAGGALRGRLAAIVDVVNHHARLTLAVDVPSGVDADSGRVLGSAVWADATVTFGLPKLGLVLFPGRDRVGRLHVADIGFPEAVLSQVAGARFWVDRDQARRLVPRLEPTAHKYQRGCAVVVAGSRAYTGAAALAAVAVLRSGAGLVHLVVPEGVRAVLQAKTTEVIVHGGPETPDGTLGSGARRTLEPLLARAGALAIGSGLGTHSETHELVRDLLANVSLPAVVDADGLTALPPPPHPAPRLVTPHAGEMARWLGQPPEVVAADRAGIALQAARARQVVVVAKGAPTFVAAPDGRLWVNGSGHAGLATAGSGDVLTGILAGLLAQRLDPADAAVLGVYLHGLAADVLVSDRAARALLAGDLLDALPTAQRQLEATT